MQVKQERTAVCYSAEDVYVLIFIGWFSLQCPMFAELKHCVRCSYSQALYLSSDDNDLKPCKIDKNLVISITTALTA